VDRRRVRRPHQPGHRPRADPGRRDLRRRRRRLQGISFHEGAHHQTWDGFAFANGRTNQTGVITSGGYATPAAHDITMRNIRIAASIKGVNLSSATDHAIYIGGAPGGISGLLFEDFDIDCGGGLATGLHLYAHNVNGPHDSIFRRFEIHNARQSVMLWDSSMHDILLEDFAIFDSAEHAFSYNHPGQRITLRRVVSAGTRSSAPFDAPEGSGGAHPGRVRVRMNPLAVPCPYCGASAGARCRLPDRLRRAFHLARVR
jgi:hypothetical protein